jgi:hypothetical protein
MVDFNLNNNDIAVDRVAKKPRKRYSKSYSKKISNAYCFEKYSKRPEVFGAKSENRFAPIYYPNYNYCKKRITTSGIPFNKTTGRFYRGSKSKNHKTPVFVSLTNARKHKTIGTG